LPDLTILIFKSLKAFCNQKIAKHVPQGLPILSAAKKSRQKMTALNVCLLRAQHVAEIDDAQSSCIFRGAQSNADLIQFS